MSVSVRSVGAGRNPAVRPPPTRAHPPRAMSATPTLYNHGRTSSAEPNAFSKSQSSRLRSPPHAGTMKFKEKEFEFEPIEETSINVVVRCRGRNEREVRENSGVVVSTDGVKGTTVDLSMGPNALSNKTYHFDRVFSPAADQAMVFDEVITPILDEVIAGFNCTIFAYGQTGTGKTYTMSGDISDVLPLPDESGIIPRVLHALFHKLESENTDNSVKCSFIELYNEELRDLLSSDDTVKLKLFEDGSRKSHGATVVQGMEETYINSASKGINLLKIGSHKRQVAATKCNDLSSRSHTVFTITLYAKRSTDEGEDWVACGKLNLVDLAGSENIQRSGAENKRAAEAGLINKSLLTLGRVINALVDKSAHIPYRESKLTRLLQDSLGGRTKTCIIATLSPARSNLEETISTLDYAFRAKNIRNKPQMNSLISKKALIREFTNEIEKLRGELIITRQRNGVYLTTETYEGLTMENESRRILSEEQRDRIDTMEVNLRNKAQELFNLTSSLSSLKKDHEETRLILDETKGALEKTEIALNHTESTLADEATLREAHAATEESLAAIGQEMISTLGRTTADIGGLHSKLKRRSHLHSMNRQKWQSSQSLVTEVTQSLAKRLDDIEMEHRNLDTRIANRIQNYLETELEDLTSSRSILAEQEIALQLSENSTSEKVKMFNDQTAKVLDEIATLRGGVREKVGEGLEGLTAAAQRIAAGVVAELESFHSQLHSSYSTLGKEIKGAFDEFAKRFQQQESECLSLREQISVAGKNLKMAGETSYKNLDAILLDEKTQSEQEHAQFLKQISESFSQLGKIQQQRLQDRISGIQRDVKESHSTFDEDSIRYNTGMDSWLQQNKSIQENLAKSRESIKTKLKKDWTSANDSNNNIQKTTRSVHERTTQIVDAQMIEMDSQLRCLDDILSRVRSQNRDFEAYHMRSVGELGKISRQTCTQVEKQFEKRSQQAQILGSDVVEQTSLAMRNMRPMNGSMQDSLASLREQIHAQPLIEYAPTGETPQKMAYQYPLTLPRTVSSHALQHGSQSSNTNITASIPSQDIADILEAGRVSPTKGQIYTDDDPALQPTQHPIKSEEETDSQSNIELNGATAMPQPTTVDARLREIDMNIFENGKLPRSRDVLRNRKNKRTASEAGSIARVAAKTPRRLLGPAVAEGPENNPVTTQIASDPRVRTLRSRGS